MEFLNSYFEDEVRDGFYIPSMVKRAWAAELKVFDEVDRICRKYGIAYFADWGTLLGAVRHQGFIPWDDDFDIVMLRKDYERFLQVAEKELPDGFAVFNYKTHSDFWHFLARVVAKPRICFEEDHLEQFYGFPYIVGIDIFIMDYIAADLEKEEIRAKVANYVLAVADAIGTPAMQGTALRNNLLRVEEMCRVKIPEWKSEHQLKVQLYQIVENLYAMFDEKESQSIAQMMPCGLNDKNLWLPKEYFAESIRVPFEGTSIPIPVAYDAVLRRKYGDYMHSARNLAGHDYPFFMTQRKQLEAVLDFEIPGFRFSKEMLQRKPAETKYSLRWKAAEAQKELENLAGQLQQNLRENNIEAALVVLEDSQQMAIELGTLMEQVKGEGLKTVAFLEQYCEVVYQMHLTLAGDVDWKKAVPFIEEMKSLLMQVKESVKSEVTNRKEIVFLPYQAAYWDAMESVYQAAAADADCDVYVVPIPYYEKDFLGNFTVMHDESGMFPEEVAVTPYDTFDFALHQPDWIVIQNPYDEHNPAVSVPEFFYSRNLQQYTEQLIYIPYFMVEEFDKEGERAYGNMRYYCTMPGVVYADKVFVQSENMRKLYIEKLVEFAGEETRKIWEKKIFGTGSPKLDRESESTAKTVIPEKWRTVIHRPDGEKKRVLLYHAGVSVFIEYKKQALVKLQEVLKDLKEQREDVAVLWYAEVPQGTSVVQKMDEIWQGYRDMVEQYRKQDWIVVLDDAADAEMAAELCDAYYGCGSNLARRCVASEKPVMIQDVEVV